MKNRKLESSVALKNTMIKTTLEVRKAKVNLRPGINCDQKDNKDYLIEHKAFKSIL